MKRVYDMKDKKQWIGSVRLSFQTLLQTHQTSRNNKKPSKQVLVMINHCLRNSQINSIPEERVFLLHSNSEQTQKHTRKLTTSASRSCYSFPSRDSSLVFDPEKPTFSVSSEHKTRYKRPGSYSLPHSLPSLWKIRNIISQLSPFDHATWQHPRESPRHVRGFARIYDVKMAQFVLKIEKLSHIIGARGSHDLRSPSPIMAPMYDDYCFDQESPNLTHFNHMCFVFFQDEDIQTGAIIGDAPDYGSWYKPVAKTV